MRRCRTNWLAGRLDSDRRCPEADIPISAPLLIGPRELLDCRNRDLGDVWALPRRAQAFARLVEPRSTTALSRSHERPDKSGHQIDWQPDYQEKEDQRGCTPPGLPLQRRLNKLRGDNGRRELTSGHLQREYAGSFRYELAKSEVEPILTLSTFACDVIRER